MIGPAVVNFLRSSSSYFKLILSTEALHIFENLREKFLKGADYLQIEYDWTWRTTSLSQNEEIKNGTFWELTLNLYKYDVTGHSSDYWFVARRGFPQIILPHVRCDWRLFWQRKITLYWIFCNNILGHIMTGYKSMVDLAEFILGIQLTSGERTWNFPTFSNLVNATVI